MKRFGAIAALVLILAIFFGVNILAVAGLRPVQLDLTEDKLYTLSEGSRKIARELESPIRLTMYYTPRATDGLPPVKAYAARVRKLLEGFARESKGKITLEVIDPEPFTEAEDRAVAAGLSGAPVAGQTLYFGLVATNDTDGQKVIPFFDPQGEQFLEYEVSKTIYSLTDPDKPSIGLISMLPLQGGFEIDPATRQPRPTRTWNILQLMQEFFDVQQLGPDITAIPEGIDALMVVHPKDMPKGVLFAIDQYILGGGRALVFVDPYCEVDVPPGGFQDQMQALMAPRASDMPELFSAWGISLEQERFAADLQRGMSVVTGRGSEPVTFLAWLGLTGDSIDQADAVTGQLITITMGTAGILKPVEGATTTITPIFTTSEQSQEMGLERVRFRPDPGELLASFVPGNKRLTLGARISGPVKTAFPGGRPDPEPAPELGPDGAPPPEAEPADPILTESAGPIDVIVIADTDMLSDRFWTQEQTLGPISLGVRKTADNGDLVVQALDNLSGSKDLISMRARGKFSRPFELVEQIQKAAEVDYRAQEAALQATLEETQARLDELQRERPGEEQGGLILSPEQKAEVERFNETLFETRKELRAVRANMTKDIESLGTRLKWVNIGLIPAVVTLAAVAMGIYRSGRRGVRQESGK
jgi:ABC-type uncharacterized transport system involved in gliding motility auxiliary subunit